MTQDKIKYYLKVIRKGYKNIPASWGLANFVLIVFGWVVRIFATEL